MAALSAPKSSKSKKAKAQVRRVRKHLALLEDRMRAAERNVARRQLTLLRVLRSLSPLANPTQRVQYRLAAARDWYARAMTQLDQQAALAYVQGPFTGLGGVTQVSSQPAPAAPPATPGQTLAARRQTLGATFRAEQVALAALATARQQVQALVKKLHHKLTAQEIAAASLCPGIGVPVTYGRWATKFLPAIGAPVSQNNLIVMVAWQSAEGTTASWNPLATTYSMPGASGFNSVGVQNFASLAQGIQAIAMTLKSAGHGYQAIVSDLQASAAPMVTATAINASDWCHGCAGGQYVLDLIPVVEQYFQAYSSR